MRIPSRKNISMGVTEMVEGQYLGIREASALSGLSVSWWRMKVWRREVPFYKVGARVLFSRADIEAMFKAGRIEGSPGNGKQRDIARGGGELPGGRGY